MKYLRSSSFEIIRQPADAGTVFLKPLLACSFSLRPYYQVQAKQTNIRTRYIPNVNSLFHPPAICPALPFHFLLLLFMVFLPPNTPKALSPPLILNLTPRTLCPIPPLRSFRSLEATFRILPLIIPAAATTLLIRV